MSTTLKTDAVWFTTKGQVVIPAWLRKQFHIENGTKAVVEAAARVSDLNFKYMAEGKGATVTARFGEDGITRDDTD